MTKTVSFAGAGPQRASDHAHTFEDVAARLLRDAESVCRYLLPGGQRRGGEYVCGSKYGGRGRSFSVNLKKGVWTDFAAGVADVKTADLLNLWAHVRGISNGDAKGEAEKWLGLDTASQRARARVSISLTAPVEPQPPQTDDDPLWYRRVKAVKSWDYHDARGNIVGQVKRYEHPETGQKVVIPWDPHRNDYRAMGDGRPIYALPEILARPNDPVVIVEGEKCADAVRDLGWLATTCQGGAQAIGKADWSAMRGRTVVLWRDNDPAGVSWEERLLQALRAAEAASVVAVAIPDGRPEKWDSADAPADERRVLLEAALASSPISQGRPPIRIADWSTGAYEGAGPLREWLVRDVWPLGVPGILAAQGDTGKGMITLDMALKVSACEDLAGQPALAPTAFGCTISRFGRVVILSAEDDEDELHRRIHGLDPDHALRKKAKDRLFMVPLPNLGGSRPFFVQARGKIEQTDDFLRVADQLLQTDDLALVVVDPLASFVTIDLNKDGAAASGIMSSFISLATATGAAVLIIHHMRKTGGGQHAVTTPEQARDAIRGQSALVDGARVAYSLWPAQEKDARRVLKALGHDAKGDTWRRRVVGGAVVKSNAPADTTVRTFVRDLATGLLVDRTSLLVTARKEDNDMLKGLLLPAIAKAAANGSPFTSTGANGLHENSERLPDELRRLPKAELPRLAKQLLDEGLIVKCRKGGAGAAAYLDVPDGPFALAITRDLKQGAIE